MEEKPEQHQNSKIQAIGMKFLREILNETKKVTLM